MMMRLPSRDISQRGRERLPKLARYVLHTDFRCDKLMKRTLTTYKRLNKEREGKGEWKKE